MDSIPGSPELPGCRRFRSFHHHRALPAAGVIPLPRRSSSARITLRSNRQSLSRPDAGIGTEIVATALAVEHLRPGVRKRSRAMAIRARHRVLRWLLVRGRAFPKVSTNTQGRGPRGFQRDTGGKEEIIDAPPAPDWRSFRSRPIRMPKGWTTSNEFSAATTSPVGFLRARLVAEAEFQGTGCGGWNRTTLHWVMRPVADRRRPRVIIGGWSLEPTTHPQRSTGAFNDHQGFSK